MNQKELDAIKSRLKDAEDALDWECVNSNLVFGDIPALLAEVEHLQQAQRWTPVSERLPAVGETVMLCLKSGNVGIGHTDGEGWRLTVREYAQFDEVAHWMPLPEPPKEG